MQVHSIISKTIPEEVLHGGHLSIRFLTDGFSLLLEDQQYTPLILNRFSNETPLSLNHYLQHCAEWLRTHSLLESFNGEASVVFGGAPAIFVPDELFSEDHAGFLLKQTNRLDAGDVTLHRKIIKRPFYSIFAVPGSLAEFSERFGGQARIIHVSEGLLSVADQVNASDHQRGFMLIETQPGALEILVVRDDRIILNNRYRLRSIEDVVYHTLNNFQQLDYDRKSIPVFHTGTLETNTEALEQLGKYLRNVLPLPYVIREIDKASIPGNAILAEATRCE